MRKTSTWILGIMMAVLSVGLFGCGTEEGTVTGPGLTPTPASIVAGGDIVDTAIRGGEFSTLVAAVQAADLEDALRDDGPFTVFAPTDEAFSKLPDGLVTALLLPQNKQKLQELLLYHVVSGTVTSGDLKWFQFTKTLQGQYVWIRNFWGSRVKVNNARVISADILAENGVIHAIDTVLIPLGFEIEMDTPQPTRDLVDTAVDAGVFETLVAAVGAAGLEDALRGAEPLTVFAPTDEAFAKLPSELVSALLLPENKSKLREILLYHVVSGRVLSGDLNYYQRVPTLEGSKVRIVKWFGNVWVNSSRVVTPDVLATNGIIHVVNRVLIPWDFTLESQGMKFNVETLEALVGTKDAEDGPPTEFEIQYLPASR